MWNKAKRRAHLYTHSHAHQLTVNPRENMLITDAVGTPIVVYLHPYRTYARISPMINVEVNRNPNENTLNVIRRFTKKVQGSGVLPRVRGVRYHSRTLSPYKVKQKTLASIKRKEEIQELIKLGKMPEKPTRFSH
jgi:ribosomal protein S21